MKKLLILATVLTSSLVAAQDSFNLAALIQTKASVDFLFTGLEIADLQKIMGDTSKSDTQNYVIERDGFTMKYLVTKDIKKNYVTFFESTMKYYVTFSAWNTSQGWMIGTVTSAQKESKGSGNDLTFVGVDSQKTLRTVIDLDAIYAFTNGKCKVPKENTVFKLEPGSETIKITGFDINLTGKKYGLKAELNRKDTKFVLNTNGKCK